MLRAWHSCATTSSRSTSLELRKRHPADAVLIANSGIETSSEEVWLLFFVLLLTRQQLLVTMPACKTTFLPHIIWLLTTGQHFGTWPGAVKLDLCPRPSYLPNCQIMYKAD